MAGRLERMTNADVEFWMLRTIRLARGRCARDCAAFWRFTAAILIFSCLRDKPITEMAQILFRFSMRVIVAPIHAVRAAAVEDLLAAAKATGATATAAESVRRRCGWRRNARRKAWWLCQDRCTL
jgi:folylpolyglutamate synthase/dihydropteroate synthase